ncbi:MAG: acetyl-CoA sensor PanZ family protein [Oceanisphaera sp.]
MRLTVHRLTHIPEHYRHHVDLILQGHALPDQAQFYLATFNDKAVALAWLQHNEPQQTPLLDFIAVRDITRRRGIGQELLRQIKQDANANGHQQIRCHIQQAPAEQQDSLNAFLTCQGFNAQTGLLS